MAPLGVVWPALAIALAASLRGGAQRRRSWISLASLALGSILGLVRGPSLPPPGSLIDLDGHWDRTQQRAECFFSGRVRHRPELRIRALGTRSPASGTSFRAEALVLPGRDRNEREARLLRWSARELESKARWAGRRGHADWHLRLDWRLTEDFAPSVRGLAGALLLGERRPLAASTRRQFRDAGLAHLLALSGLHVGLFLLLVRRILALGPWGAFAAEWPLLLMLPFLPALFGGGPSISRAVCMAGYWLLLRRLGARPCAREALAVAACVECLRSPGALLSPAFLLSYLATLALICLFQGRNAPPMALGGRLLAWLRSAVLASFLCTLATLPIVWDRFGRLPLLGPVWNLLAGPLCALTLMLGWISLPLGLLPGGKIWLWPASRLLAALSALAAKAGGDWSWVLTDLRAPDWSWWAWSLGFAIFVRGRRRRSIAWLLMALPVLTGLAAGLGPIS